MVRRKYLRVRSLPGTLGLIQCASPLQSKVREKACSTVLAKEIKEYFAGQSLSYGETFTAVFLLPADVNSDARNGDPEHRRQPESP